MPLIKHLADYRQPSQRASAIPPCRQNCRSGPAPTASQPAEAPRKLAAHCVPRGLPVAPDDTDEIQGPRIDMQRRLAKQIRGSRW